ncbi:formiminoglutamate deiminase [Kineococcus radiotolerans SRS30216 = ATCC BAA-149]|uniref:Formiminoglutamate deiminase n=1 Tax=Kineococcus radiotolerans (strain ATCC BAA-149 / DSM 14245 / SRS30216) TaxID=266940 RepID=A6WGH1_KINRD|nr:formiminoglutamate deiminase [Kineococcus radiotolerans SRS30216 = ATCC BAA-149]
MGSVTSFWCESAWLDGGPVRGVRVESADGRTTALTRAENPAPGDRELRGLVFPGLADAHSHAFHRGLRGRTHRDGGSFWTWRTAMYALAGRLDPDVYRDLATAVFAEMVLAGWTAVGEFHYVHHRRDGTPYDDPNAFALALRDAARAAGIRLTLLDTLYLTSAPGEPPLPEQRRFSDGTAAAWAQRVREIPADAGFRVGVAAHSVRAVGPDDLAVVAATARDLGAPVHVHLSEQPAENDACRAAHGATPTELLERAGLLGPDLTVVHANHLTDADVARLGSARVTVAACPTTEADLGDGVGRARDLATAGAVLALGSDQHAVVDPFLEARGLEGAARLGALRRGAFDPADLVAALTTGGHRSLGLDGGTLAVGAPCDLVAVDARSVRTAGSDPAQLVLSATAADVTDVVVGGETRVRDRVHTTLGDPADLLLDALRRLT